MAVIVRRAVKSDMKAILGMIQVRKLISQKNNSMYYVLNIVMRKYKIQCAFGSKSEIFNKSGYHRRRKEKITLSSCYVMILYKKKKMFILFVYCEQQEKSVSPWIIIYP